MRRRASRWAVVVVSAAAGTVLPAQVRGPSDRSLAQSLLAVSFPGPAAPVWRVADSVHSKQRARVDVAYGRALRAGAGGLRPTMVLALRGEELTRQTTGPTAGLLGARIGLRADEPTSSLPVTSAEVYFGGRTMHHTASATGVEGGFDVVFGWGGFGADTRASFGMRAPVEFVAQGMGSRFTVFAAPTMAWGHIRMRGCEDRGPGDNCGDLGVQIAFGRTRFAAAGGASLTLLPADLSVSAGIQRLFAVGETERVWLGGSWTP